MKMTLTQERELTRSLEDASSMGIEAKWTWTQKRCADGHLRRYTRINIAGELLTKAQVAKRFPYMVNPST